MRGARAATGEAHARAARLLVLALLAAFVSGGAASTPEPPAEAFDVVVIDAGHGGADYGALGPSGLREKDVALAVARRLGRALEGAKLRVVYTRERDEFVPLAERTEAANRARGDLFLSIHANAAPDRGVRGAETFFQSLEASDEEAHRVAMVENEVFRRAGAVPDGADVVGSILGDLIRTDHLRRSSEVAAAIQQRLGSLSGPARGVKQAPFVVLMGVNMPSVLVEVGFLTHAAEERALRSGRHQDRLARAIADAVLQYRDMSEDGEVAR